jgi:hypothetical protein
MTTTTHCANCGAEVPIDKPHRVGDCAPATMTLTEFLLARIADDEAVARRIQAVGPCEPAYDPAHVLAECEAKRQIVEMHDPQEGREDMPAVCSTCGGFVRRPDYLRGSTDSGYVIPWPCPTLRALALPYADHPDYQEAWRA